MDKVTNLGHRRAEITGMSDAWQPIDLLRKVLSEVEQGEAKPERMLIIYTSCCKDKVEEEEKEGTLHTRSAQTERSHVLLMCQGVIHITMHDWFNE